MNWGAGGIRELTLDANKIEQMLKYRKASLPKSVSTIFVTHCRLGTQNKQTNMDTQKLEINTVKLTIPAVLTLQNSIFIQEEQ